MTKLTRYSTFKSLKSGAKPDQKTPAAIATETSELELFIKLLKENASTVKKKAERITHGK